MRLYSANIANNQIERQKATVLAIDDDPAVIADITRILNTGGYPCHCFRNLASAVEQFSVVAPDLIIADLAIAGAGGRKLIESLRSEIGYFEASLMFLSSAQSADIIHRNSDAGGAYYVRKPFDALVLLELVDKAIWKQDLATAL